MAKALLILANGFEEIEAVTIIDVLRRADIEVTAAGVDDKTIQGSHHISIVSDRPLMGLVANDFDAVILPGGMPGAANLRDSAAVRALLVQFHQSGKLVAAICAAPIALEAAGILHGKRATSYPGYDLPSADYLAQRVVEDGNIVTSRGPGTALEFALVLVRRLAGEDVAERLVEVMLVRR